MSDQPLDERGLPRRILESVGLYDSIRAAADQRRLKASHSYLLLHPSYDAELHKVVVRSPDPVRYSMLAMALKTIEREKIPGDLAELGVYKGHTSRFIRTVTSDRTLYLFDSFEGFARDDLEVSDDARFQDTSFDTVKRRLASFPRVEFRKGYFPETAAGLEDRKFAFVLLDFDLYRPTLSALEFFYPRVSRGGYIILHDYTSPESDHAIERATQEFLADKPEFVTEWPDRHGSVSFRKI